MTIKLPKTAIQPTRAQDFPEWYQQVVKAADLAEMSSVRGCMVIKPWGYAIWERIQQILDTKFKALGHKNIYCPLFIPLSHFQREADHVKGFAKECAVVTHHRLQENADGKLEPAGKLEEPLVVRPTSETIIGECFSRWAQSYRDLPIMVNQWANVVRWEMRTRLFLRTSEFLWQEGHTAHSTREEAEAESKRMLACYVDFVENIMAMPIIQGEKTPNERFPGAVDTYTMEAMMQDGKALQLGTSHFLGQNFAKACNIQFLNQAGTQEFAWTTSWGVTTRLIGGLIMTHSDDDGLVLPPTLAPSQIVIMPLIHNPEKTNEIMHYCDEVKKELQYIKFRGEPIRVEIDNRDFLRGGEKAWSWVKKGVPIRLEIGAKELEQHSVFMGRRDMAYKERSSISRETLMNQVTETLESIQSNLWQRASDFKTTNMLNITNKKDLYEYFKQKNQLRGFVTACWCGDGEVEKQINKDLGVSIRCIPHGLSEVGKCIFTGKPNSNQVIIARAY